MFDLIVVDAFGNSIDDFDMEGLSANFTFADDTQVIGGSNLTEIRLDGVVHYSAKTKQINNLF